MLGLILGITIPFLYLLMIGAVGSRSTDYWVKRCHYKSDAMAMRNVAAVFWPITLPILAGGILGSTSEKGTKDERRREAELTEAKHRVKVAQLQHEESAWLDKQLGVKK